MSTAGLSDAVEELLKSFELLPEPEKRQVVSAMIRRTFASATEVNDAQLAALYAEFAETDSKLAEEGIEDYEKGLVSEDAE